MRLCVTGDAGRQRKLGCFSMGRRGRQRLPGSATSAPRGTRQKWLIALGGLGVVAAAAVFAFNIAPSPAGQHPPPSSAPLQVVPDSPPAGPLGPDRAGLESSFAGLQTRLHATAGVVIRAVGSDPGGPVILGEWTSGPAWSTIKVPLAIAEMRQRNSDQVSDDVTAAITQSDNAAAESIWASLGEPTEAAAKVEAVLGAAGDATIVQTQKVRPEFSTFGQTEWSLVSQAQFLASAACDSRDQPVLELMGQIEPSQRWGLGVIPGTRIKGGWGPSPAGRYLVRQIAVVPTPKGSTVVAMAVEPDSGDYSEGVADLTELAGWLRAHAEALPSGTCGV